MDYTELAKRFLRYSYQFRNCGHQKNINETMRGETFTLIYIFKKGDHVLPGEISNEMSISSARVAAILNNLENKGLIVREIDKSDRRRILVRLTQRGAALAKEHNQRIVNITIRTLELLGERDAKELVRITGRLAGLMNRIVNDD